MLFYCLEPLYKKQGLPYLSLLFQLALGLVLNIFLAAVVNIGMNLGLMPVTGIALPFLSAGGSSLIATWIAVGLIESIAVRGDGARQSFVESEAGASMSL